MTETWRDRIVDSGDADPRTLVANADNWRQHGNHQRQALEAILDDVGVVQRIIVNKRNRHILDGHLRVSIALDQGLDAVPVVWVDLDDEEEAKILATFDAIGALAYANADKLASLVEGVSFDSPDLQSTMRRFASTLPKDAPYDPATDTRANRYENEDDDVEFPEFDETAADDVRYITCPHCGESFPV